MQRYNRPNSVTDLLNHIQKGEEAIELLRELWIAVESPYAKSIPLTPELERKLDRFFEFDDSE